MLTTFVKTCGGESAPGVIGLLGKPVRVDYIRKTMQQLARDKPIGRTLFYKALPVNLEAWIRALCEFDVHTYVPRWWGLKHARFDDRSQHHVAMRMGVHNLVNASHVTMVAFASSAQSAGLRVEAVTAEMVTASSSAHVPMMRFETPRDHFLVEPRCPRTEDSIVNVRPSSTLEYEEIIGLLHRGGRVVCVGGKTSAMFTILLDSTGEVFKFYSDAAGPTYLQTSRAACATWSLWTVELYLLRFIDEDPLCGADARVTISSSIRLETLMFIDIVSTARKRHDLFVRIASAMVTTAVASSRKSYEECAHRVRPCGSPNIASILCASVKKTKCPRPVSATGSTVDVPDTTPGWEGVLMSSAGIAAPRKCRNGWVMPSGKTIEIRNSVVTDALMHRARWPSNTERCFMCPVLHPDVTTRAKERCASLSCKTIFRTADTFTHYCFRGTKNRRAEVDKFDPLFTDAALRELGDNTAFSF